jgi:hypothetical protein
LNPKDDLFYLPKQGSVSTHCGHVSHGGIFARADQIDKHDEKMLKDFEVANVKPSTASPMMHQIGDRVYNPKATSNSIVKAQKTCFSDRGVNTKAVSAQVLVDYMTVSLDTSCLFFLHGPYLTLTGGAKKGRPKKYSPMRVMIKYFNSQVVETDI